MKELLKQAFQAGRDFGHAMGTGRPTYGLTFDEWYSENEKQALSIDNVVGQSEQLVCECEEPNVDNEDKPLPTCKDCFRPMV